LDDRKAVHISNIDRLAIVQPREFSRWSKSKFGAESGIKGLQVVKQKIKGSSVKINYEIQAYG